MGGSRAAARTSYVSGQFYVGVSPMSVSRVGADAAYADENRAEIGVVVDKTWLPFQQQQSDIKIPIKKEDTNLCLEVSDCHFIM